jgi:hypothetical protein
MGSKGTSIVGAKVPISTLIIPEMAKYTSTIYNEQIIAKLYLLTLHKTCLSKKRLSLAKD